MVKNIFIYIILVIIIAVAVWFFIQKSRTASDSQKDIISIMATESPTPMTSPVSNSGDQEGWIKFPNGLEYKDIVIGTGREAKEGNFVTAHYSGTLADGTKFDSSYDRGQPFSFILGGGMVIKGWDIGLVGMKIAGKRKLIIPPDLGYGPRANGPIPANSTLFFDIELVGVSDKPPT